MKLRAFISLLKGIQPSDTRNKTDAIVANRKLITELKHQSIDRMRILEVSEKLPPLDFSYIDDFGFTLYKGLKVKDLTSLSLDSKGVTFLEVKADKDVIIELHDHLSQSQTITVQKGAITDCISGIRFIENKSLFVPPGDPHKIKYEAGTVAIIYYSPKLKELKQRRNVKK